MRRVFHHTSAHCQSTHINTAVPKKMIPQMNAALNAAGSDAAF
jgi:hypothetical protein